MSCKGICLKHKAPKPLGHKSRYGEGQARCQICDIFINWEGLWCVCCGYRLRRKPRNLKYKSAIEHKEYKPDTNKNIAELNDDGTVSYLNNVDTQELELIVE